jgi:hypothetical protein
MKLKKKHCEKTKIPLALDLFFFYLKDIFIVSLCVLTIYNFLYLIKYQIISHL